MTEQNTPADAETLTYDVQERMIYDANGLIVARDVNAADAALFVYADRLREAAAALRGGPHPAAYQGSLEDHLDHVLDQIAAYQAKGAADSEREALQAPTRAHLIAEALAYEAAKFDRPDGEDSELNVSGADLVDWFADWRLRMKAALA